MARDDRVTALLERHGTTFAHDVRVDLSGEPGPSDVWGWYVACLLMSARISADLAVRAARAYLAEVGPTVGATAQATWKQRVDVLNANGYARYDERTSRMLGETADAVLDRYAGDLRRIRQDAEGSPDRIHELLQQFKGVGTVGADIFCREIQLAWDELYPFVDEAAAGVAGELGLGRSADTLAGLVPRRDLPRFLAALVRADQADDLDAVREGRSISVGDPEAVLDRLTRAQLYQLARKDDVPGRSSMDRAELLEALAG